MQKIETGQTLEELREAYEELLHMHGVAKKKCDDIATRKEELHKLYLEADKAMYGALLVEKKLITYVKKAQEEYEELSEKLYPGEL